MMSLDPQLSLFASEAAKVLDGAVELATVDNNNGWISRFAQLAQPAGGPGWIAQLHPDGEAVDRCDWYGLLDLWPDTTQRVLVRRFPVVGAYGEMAGITVLAARKKEDLERAVIHGRALWRDWRRNTARVRNARGGDVEITPAFWDQVYLAESLVEEIRANVMRFASARDMYIKLGLPYRRGLLFYGPPGNGKTMICRAIVTALGWPVVYVSPSSRKDAGDEVRRAFHEASVVAPCVLWFDDVESLFDTDATLSNFLNLLDGATSAEGTLVLATSNRPDRLDPAIVARPSRFDRIFEIGAPQESERRRFFHSRFRPGLGYNAIQELIEHTSGMSMAFVQEVFVGAALRALQRGEVPDATDAFAVVAALKRHMRTADSGFESAEPTGFARSRE